jgi:hypothetical protein
LLTFGTHHRVIGAAGQGIAAVNRAKIAIVAIQICTWLATGYEITGFDAVANVVVVAGRIIGRVFTGISGLIAGIHGTGHPVIAVNRCARLAGAGGQIAGFRTVAEHAIIAVSIAGARLTVKIIPVVGKVAIVVQASSVTAVILATIYRCRQAWILYVHVSTRIVGWQNVFSNGGEGSGIVVLMAAATEYTNSRVVLAETGPGHLPSGFGFRSAMTTDAAYAVNT